MLRCAKVFALVGMLCQLTSAGDSCAEGVEDELSLLQTHAETNFQAINAAEDQGRTAVKPKDQGFYNWDGTNKMTTCFLSKKSLFTCPYEWCQHTMTAGPGPPGCRDVEGLEGVDKENTNAADCVTCLAGMRKGLEGDKWLVKGEKPPECVRCGAQWTEICLKGDKKVLWRSMAQDLNWFGDYIPDQAGMSADQVKKQQAVFQAQEAFMLLLSGKLAEHKVSLYLDFQDDEANKLVKKYGGRAKAFAKTAFYSKMLNILRQRAETSNNFLKWIGASGDFCLAEQSGRQAADTKTFAHPPLATLQGSVSDHSYDKALCLGGQTGFFVDLCTKCGGTNCNAGCNGETLA